MGVSPITTTLFLMILCWQLGRWTLSLSLSCLSKPLYCNIGKPPNTSQAAALLVLQLSPVGSKKRMICTPEVFISGSTITFTFTFWASKKVRRKSVVLHHSRSSCCGLVSKQVELFLLYF